MLIPKARNPVSPGQARGPSALMKTHRLKSVPLESG